MEALTVSGVTKSVGRHVLGLSRGLLHAEPFDRYTAHIRNGFCRESREDFISAESRLDEE